MPKRNIAWVLVIAVITLLLWRLPQTIAERDVVYRAFAPLADARSQIHQRFVDDTNDAILVNSAVDAGIRAMVAQLQDAHAIYLNQDEYERFRSRTDGVFGGIGVDVWSTPAGLEVLSRDPNSPAAQAGILPGDIITHVDGLATSSVSLVDAVNNLLNGPPDTEAALTIVRPSDSVAKPPREITVRRTEIHVDSIRGWGRTAGGGWRYMIDGRERIAFVRLTKFTQDVDERLDVVMEGLLQQGLRGLILDLRDNTGGLLDSAREVSDRFLEAGLIVRTGGRRVDDKQWFAMRDGTYPSFPMVVLINGSTASAAEIVAGSLRDHRRAAVVGERSYGKGSVQEVIELDNRHGAIKLTTSYYFLPSGQCIDRTFRSAVAGVWGVAPTVPVNLTDRQRKKCLDAWREIGREAVPAGTPPTSGPAEESKAVDDVSRVQAAAQALLEADLQLNKAYELLLSRLAPNAPEGMGATSEKAGT
jgi:carboxyl-terminal processing protease